SLRSTQAATSSSAASTAKSLGSASRLLLLTVEAACAFAMAPASVGDIASAPLSSNTLPTETLWPLAVCNEGRSRTESRLSDADALVRPYIFSRSEDFDAISKYAVISAL